MSRKNGEFFASLSPLLRSDKKRRKPFSLRRRVIEKDQYSVTLGVGAVLVVTRLRIHAHKDKQDESTDTAGDQVKQEKPAAFADVMQTTHRHCNAGNESEKIPKGKENISDYNNKCAIISHSRTQEKADIKADRNQDVQQRNIQNSFLLALPVNTA